MDIKGYYNDWLDFLQPNIFYMVKELIELEEDPTLFRLHCLDRLDIPDTYQIQFYNRHPVNAMPYISKFGHVGNFPDNCKAFMVITNEPRREIKKTATFPFSNTGYYINKYNAPYIINPLINNNVGFIALEDYFIYFPFGGEVYYNQIIYSGSPEFDKLLRESFYVFKNKPRIDSVGLGEYNIRLKELDIKYPCEFIIFTKPDFKGAGIKQKAYKVGKKKIHEKLKEARSIIILPLKFYTSIDNSKEVQS